MATTLANLMIEAKRLGVSVHICHLDKKLGGMYDDEASAVYIQIGLTMPQLKQVLGHELSHAYYRHLCSTGPNERQADRRGSYLLVDPREYAAAEAMNADPAAIAEELGLTASVVRDFQRYWLHSQVLREGDDA